MSTHRVRLGFFGWFFLVTMAICFASMVQIWVEAERYLESGRQCIAASQRKAPTAELREACKPLTPRKLWWQQ